MYIHLLYKFLYIGFPDAHEITINQSHYTYTLIG